MIVVVGGVYLQEQMLFHLASMHQQFYPVKCVSFWLNI